LALKRFRSATCFSTVEIASRAEGPARGDDDAEVHAAYAGSTGSSR
jgi:hypothetical protein